MNIVRSRSGYMIDSQNNILFFPVYASSRYDRNKHRRIILQKLAELKPIDIPVTIFCNTVKTGYEIICTDGEDICTVIFTENENQNLEIELSDKLPYLPKKELNEILIYISENYKTLFVV